MKSYHVAANPFTVLTVFYIIIFALFDQNKFQIVAKVLEKNVPLRVVD